MTRRRRGRAAVVVVGDVGRSPRMQYHALSLANQAGLEVDLIGYAGSQVHPSVAEHPRIHLRLLGMPFPSGLSRPLYLLLLPIKLVAQVLCFLWVLCVATPPPDFYLLQNPPTIPTFTVVRFAGLVRRASFVIDWHNFGFTLFGLRFGPAHPLVKIHKWYETTIARQAAAHICVTRAMQQELANNWDIRATVLYDRPPSFFRPSTLEEMREVLGRIDQSLLDSCFSPPAPGTAQWTLRPDRPALVVSSSSWTADEDFDVLLEAALMYDRRVAAMAGEGEFGGDGGGEGEGSSEAPLLDSRGTDKRSPAAAAGAAAARGAEAAATGAAGAAETAKDSSSAGGSRNGAAGEGELGGGVTAGAAAGLGTNAGRLKAGEKFPNLAFIVTGKGALRSHYEAKMRRLRLRHVSFRTAWLAPEDYPRLLGSADLGVSLHTSSSGLDLPMKVVDMFGCGVPVCAISYSCIHELVKDGTNGLLFSDSSELASQLIDIFCGFPEGSAALKPHSPTTASTYSSAFTPAGPSTSPLPSSPTSPSSPSSTPSSVTLLQKLGSGALATGAAGKWADEWGANVLPLVERLSGGDLREMVITT
ncbi:unnamed protein product [Closterium sp. Yama58-4]|nr:unnamed protein product [Closterium sp. Yama58-4]